MKCLWHYHIVTAYKMDPDNESTFEEDSNNLVQIVHNEYHDEKESLELYNSRKRISDIRNRRSRSRQAENL